MQIIHYGRHCSGWYCWHKSKTVHFQRGSCCHLAGILITSRAFTAQSKHRTPRNSIYSCVQYFWKGYASWQKRLYMAEQKIWLTGHICHPFGHCPRSSRIALILFIGQSMRCNHVNILQNRTRERESERLARLQLAFALDVFQWICLIIINRTGVIGVLNGLCEWYWLDVLKHLWAP